MTSHYPQKLRNQLLISLFYAWLTYSNFHACWSYKNNNVTRCVESEKEALLKFKQGIRVDYCGLLDSWIDDRDCCKWRNVVCDRHSGHVTSIHLPGIKCLDDDADGTDHHDTCLEDKLPDCWGYFNQLSVLNLQNNKLWGNLPSSMGMLNQLRGLQLGNNSLSGDFPAFLANCTSLRALDLAHNSLSGYIPPTFGSLKQLIILTLQNNRFVGTIPSSLCYLSQLQSIIISNNRISGTIPKCIYKLTGMATTEDLLVFLDPKSSMLAENDALIMWKGKEIWFDNDNFIGKRKTIDFSNNRLEGLIPERISTLIGLVTINLSGNHLTGAIPLEIGQLTSLETLDLSHNHLSGEIPTSLAQVSSLEVLDLSYNNLSGEIPTGPQLQLFNASFYAGNPRLCGAPLPTCHGNKAPATSISQDGDGISRKKEHDLDDFMLGLYISVILGFIVGFWGVCGSLVLKQSWRHAFFRVCDDLKDRIYVTVVVTIARVWRRS